MPLSAIETKAVRLISSGRVTVRLDRPYEVEASVRGDHGEYVVRYDPARGFSCTCPCSRRCSHITAVMVSSDAWGALEEPGQ